MSININLKSNKKNNTSIEKNIYYLNLKEIKTLCDKYKIPYKILYENKSGILKNSGMLERKSFIIKRLLKFHSSKKVTKQSIFPKSVVYFDRPKKIKPADKVYFGIYKNTDKEILDLMKSLTDSKFKFGAIAQFILVDSWISGNPITYKKFAEIWLKNFKKETTHPEWAYLTDLAKGEAESWKDKRNKIAREVLNEFGV